MGLLFVGFLTFNYFFDGTFGTFQFTFGVHYFWKFAVGDHNKFIKP